MRKCTPSWDLSLSWKQHAKPSFNANKHVEQPSCRMLHDAQRSRASAQSVRNLSAHVMTVTAQTSCPSWPNITEQLCTAIFDCCVGCQQPLVFWHFMLPSAFMPKPVAIYVVHLIDQNGHALPAEHCDLQTPGLSSFCSAKFAVQFISALC